MNLMPSRKSNPLSMTGLSEATSQRQQEIEQMIREVVRSLSRKPDSSTTSIIDYAIISKVLSVR